MQSTTQIPVEEYLNTSYDPDVDYIDGEIQERNLGERSHSELQGALIVALSLFRKSLSMRVFPEQRVQVKSTRFRVPDICVVLGRQELPAIFVDPPFICIEILSPEDTFTRYHERLDDYTIFGVPYIWIIDPIAKTAWSYEQGRQYRVEDLILRTVSPEIVIDLKEVFREIESYQQPE